MVILYCFGKTFYSYFCNHLGRESNVPPAGFPRIFIRSFSSGVAIPNLSDSAGVSSACFHSPSVLREAWIPDWSGRSLARSSEVSGAGGVE